MLKLLPFVGKNRYDDSNSLYELKELYSYEK